MFRVTFQAYDIKAGGCVPESVPVHVVLRATNDAVLLAGGNGFRGAAIVDAAAVSYLNEDQAVCVAHDQVDFTTAAVEVTVK